MRGKQQRRHRKAETGGSRPTVLARRLPLGPCFLSRPTQAPKGYRIQGEAVLLTYQGWPAMALAMWARFVEFVRHRTNQWRVKHWSATLETNEDGTSHAHLMLQFVKPVDRTAAGFIFEGRRPNASSSQQVSGRRVRKWS